MIPNDFIQTLLARVDIVEVIARYVPLKKTGANYVACCPFHSEKTPSFSVSPTKQFYHCFGCGAHGTAVGFLMEHGGRSFPDAVEELARDAHLEVPRDERPGQKEQRAREQNLNELLLVAAKFYRAQLKDAPRAVAYLKGRGLTGEIAARFGLGYAPDAWQNLKGVFAEYDNPTLDAAGLVISGENGKRYDRFRDRVMFPIHDSRGRVIGFGGRVLDEGDPKYLNSPETPVFSKGRELYGLYLAHAAIRDAGRVVVVEGYMDVVALAQHGVECAVATLGTATTPIHAQKLFRLTDTVVFCFDGDGAGRNAAWRALENTLAALADGKNAAFLFLPDGEDPDDYVRKRGRAAFERALDSSVPLSEFLLSELCSRHPPATAEGRAAFVVAARPYIAQITAPVLLAILRRRIADLSGLPESELRALLNLPHAGPRERLGEGKNATAHRPAFRAGVRRAPSLARELISGLLLNPGLARVLPLPRPHEHTPEGAALAALVDFCAIHTEELTAAGILQYFAGSPHEAVLASALAMADDQSVTREHAESQLRAGLDRWWELARRAGDSAAPPQGQGEASPEEAERLRQLALVRQTEPTARPQGNTS